MLRLTIKLALLVTVVCLMPLALIRAQPYDDSELRAFLTPPEGCPAPCFMGIRPGVTTVEEAIAILEAHEWITDVKLETNAILWTWDKAPSQWVVEGHVSAIVFINDQLTVISPTLKVKLGDLMLVLGYPDWIEVPGFCCSVNRPYNFIYLNSGIEVTVDSELCPLNSYNLVAHLFVADIRSPSNIPTVETACSRYVKYVRNLRHPRPDIPQPR